MKSNEKNRWGAISAFIIGVLSLVYGISFLLIPTGGIRDYRLVLPAYTENPIPYIVFSVSAASIAVLGLGFVPVLSRYVGSKRSFLLRWVTVLALVGFSVEMVDQVRSLGILARSSVLFGSFSEILREIVIASEHLRYIDDTTLFRSGFVGLWFIVVNLYGMKRGRLARVLAVLGIIGGMLMLIAMAGNIGRSGVLMKVGIGATAVIGPIWYLWTGMVLLTKKKK